MRENPTARLTQPMVERLRLEHFSSDNAVTTKRIRSWINYRRRPGPSSSGRAAAPAADRVVPYNTTGCASVPASAVSGRRGTVGCACRDGLCTPKKSSCFADPLLRKCSASCTCIIENRCNNPMNAIPAVALPVDQCLVDWFCNKHVWAELPAEVVTCCGQQVALSLLCGTAPFECARCHQQSLFSFCRGKVIKGDRRNHCTLCKTCVPAGSRHCNNCGKCIQPPR